MINFEIFLIISILVLRFADSKYIDRDIAWKNYDSVHLKPAIRDYYSYTWKANIPVPQNHPLSHGTFEIFVRRFSRTESPKKHLWLISGGPGSSTSGIERALNLQLPDTAIYIMDNRGLGHSHKFCHHSQSAVCRKNPKKCYDALDYSPKKISLHETAQDYNFITRIILKMYGGEVFLYGSSYGATLAYTAFKFDPKLYSGVLAEAFIPEMRLNDNVDVRKHVVESCFRSETCRKAIGSRLNRKDAEGLMETIMKNDTVNRCKSAVEFLADHVGQNLNALLNSWIRSAFYRKTDLRPVFMSLLYSVAYCPDPDNFNVLLTDFYEECESSNEETDANMMVAWGLHSSNIPNTNYFFSGHIRFSEYCNGNRKKCQICKEKGFLNSSNWSDACGMISDYKEDYDPYLYEPEEPQIIMFDYERSPTRLVIVSGKLDTQTPHDLAEREFNRLPMREKFIFTADHGGHGIIDSLEVPGLNLDLLLSFTMTGSETALEMIKKALDDHNKDSERIWKNSGKREYAGKDIWDFSESKVFYCWWKFFTVLICALVPVLVSLVYLMDIGDAKL